MARQKLSVVVTRRLPPAVEARMSELFDTKLRDTDTPMTREELAAAMREADVLVPTLTDKIDAGLLGQAGDRLKLIANYGAGVDHIDVATARQRGVLVSNTPGAVTEDTADMTLALILAVTRRIPEGLARVKSGDWEGWSPTALMGGRIAGRRLGILGMGRIGQAGGHLLGESRPDAGPDGYRVCELPAYPLHLPFAERAAAEADEAVGGGCEHLARRGD